MQIYQLENNEGMTYVYACSDKQMRHAMWQYIRAKVALGLTASQITFTWVPIHPTSLKTIASRTSALRQHS